MGGHWARWALGENGQLGLMGIRKNEQLRQMGTLGPMDIKANEHWGKMGTGKNEHQSKWALGNWGK